MQGKTLLFFNYVLSVLNFTLSLLIFFVNRAIPSYFKWFSYFSWFKYGNEALLINQWSNIDKIECTNLNSTCPKNGDIVLEMYNFEKKNFYFSCLDPCKSDI